MKPFDKFARALSEAKTARQLNQIGLQVIQDRTLISMELYHLGRLAGMQLCAVIVNRKPSTQAEVRPKS